MLFKVTQLLHCVDTTLGRFDIHSMSQQMLMEAAVADMDLNHILKDANGNFLDISEWDGVVFNDRGEVSGIDYTLYRDAQVHPNGGTIDLQYLPPSVKRIELFRSGLEIRNLTLMPPNVEYVYYGGNRLSDELDISGLPETLIELYLSDNHYAGSFELKELPSRLQVFTVHFNHLSGTICLPAMPEAMRELGLSENEFGGTICLNGLPDSLEDLQLYRNRFHGSLDFGSLPVALRKLFLPGNAFSGSVLLNSLSDRIAKIYLHQNAFDGNARMGIIPESLEIITLYSSGFNAVVDEAGDAVDDARVSLEPPGGLFFDTH